MNRFFLLKIRNDERKGHQEPILHSPLFWKAAPVHLVLSNTEGHLGGAEMCRSDMLKDDDI